MSLRGSEHSMTPRICMLTSGHPPADDRIFYKEARSLARRYGGIDLAGPYPEQIPARTDGVSFHCFERAPGLRGRMATLRRLYAAGFRCQADVYHCHEPESLVVALALKAGTGAAVVFDSHEAYGASLSHRLPDTLRAITMRTYATVERQMLHRCDAAIGASWAISAALETVVPPDRVATILNVPVPEVFGEAPPRTWGDTTVLCHDGHLTFDRGLKTMLRAVKLVAEREPVRLKIVGDVFGAERLWLETYVSRHRLEDVVVRTGWLDYERVGAEIAECHIGLIALQPLPNNVVTSSNKVFNYMLYGLPFVGPDFRLATQQLVREEACGVLADTTSPEAYAAAILGLIEDRDKTQAMGERALAASLRQYRWEHMEPRLFGLYDRILADPIHRAA